MTILSHGKWIDNADLMVDLFDLGYLTDDHPVLDCTYGMGAFWSRYRPEQLIGSDADSVKAPHITCSFTKLPFADGAVHTIVYDPPYKLNGSPDPEIDYRYGVHDYTRWQDRMALIYEGAVECARVLGKGFLLIKVQDQVVSGRKRWQTDLVTEACSIHKLRKVDRFDLPSYRPQPSGRVQRHSHSNTSQLLVFSK